MLKTCLAAGDSVTRRTKGFQRWKPSQLPIRLSGDMYCWRTDLQEPHEVLDMGNLFLTLIFSWSSVAREEFVTCIYLLSFAK